jgi:hypothetical protein
MKKVTSLRFLTDGTGFHFVFEDGEESILQSSKQEGLKKLNQFLSNAQIDDTRYSEMYHIINDAKKLSNGKLKRKKFRDPEWIFSLIGIGRNTAHLEIGVPQMNSGEEVIPHERKEPIFA